MNIFYDDLYERDLQDDLAYFQNRGWQIRLSKTDIKPDISRLGENPYQYLDDYKNMGFKFIQLPEQEVVMILEEETFRCFGKCHTGFFLLNEEGTVYLLLNEYESQGDLSSWFANQSDEQSDFLTHYQSLISQGIGLLFVNENLQDFVSSYSYLMMRIFSLKAQSKRSSAHFEIEAAMLEREIADLSPVAMAEGSYWYQMVFQISENLGWLQLNPGVIPYLKDYKKG